MSQTAADHIPELSKTQLLAFFGMVVGMFMAVLDIQIVASSLPVIAAGLSASSDELSWVQTSYLIAEVIIIPITGYLARLLSTRILYFWAVVGFTVMSICCALAWNLQSMILFRSLQGFFGGAMIPTTFSTIYIIFPPQKRQVVTIIIGLVVTIAPTLGPTIGGYITEALSWHFMFLLNAIPGIFVAVVLLLYADFDKPNFQLLKNFDYVGVLLLIVTLGALQYFLEEGNKKGWLEDSFLLSLLILVIIGFVVLISWELLIKHPILDLRAFTNKNFVFGCCYSMVIGVGLYGAVYLLPFFLSYVTGLSTVQIGLTMMVTGLSQFLSAPIAGRMASSVDLRIMLAIGLGLFAVGCYLNSFLTADAKFHELLVPQIVRGLSLMFCFIPMSDIALGSMKKEQVPNASGLYNLMRNLGGAVGLAIISTIITNKTKVFSQYIGENVQASSMNANRTLLYLQNIVFTNTTNPQKASYLALQNLINREALIIAINHVFVMIAILFVISITLLPFTSKPVIVGKDTGGH